MIAAQMYDLGERTTKDILEVADRERSYMLNRDLAYNAMQIRKDDLIRAGFNPALAYMSGGAQGSAGPSYTSASSSNALGKTIDLQNARINQANSASQINMQNQLAKKAEADTYQAYNQASLNSAQELRELSQVDINKKTKEAIEKQILSEMERARLLSAQTAEAKARTGAVPSQIKLTKAQTGAAESSGYENKFIPRRWVEAITKKAREFLPKGKVPQ